MTALVERARERARRPHRVLVHCDARASWEDRRARVRPGGGLPDHRRAQDRQGPRASPRRSRGASAPWRKLLHGGGHTAALGSDERRAHRGARRCVRLGRRRARPFAAVHGGVHGRAGGGCCAGSSGRTARKTKTTAFASPARRTRLRRLPNTVSVGSIRERERAARLAARRGGRVGGRGVPTAARPAASITACWSP